MLIKLTNQIASSGRNNNRCEGTAIGINRNEPEKYLISMHSILYIVLLGLLVSLGCRGCQVKLQLDSNQQWHFVQNHLVKLSRGSLYLTAPHDVTDRVTLQSDWKAAFKRARWVSVIQYEGVLMQTGVILICSSIQWNSLISNIALLATNLQVLSEDFVLILFPY